MKIVTKAESGQWLKATTEYERIMATAATKAMRDVGKDGIQKGRASIAAGGFSSKFQRTLRAINKPASGYVLNPSVYIHSTINYADVFETGRTITANTYLWLPLPAVPPGKNRDHMTPREYIKNIGPLVFMRPHGRRPMLGRVVVRRSARARKFGLFPTKGRQLKGASAGDVKETIPMFVGFSSITIPKKFDVKGAVQDAFDNLDEFYAVRLEPYEGRR